MVAQKEFMFRLNQLKGGIYQQILLKSGWKSLNQFEIEAPASNYFNISINDGLLYNQADYKLSFNEGYDVYVLNLHHLEHESLLLILKELDAPSLSHYEVYHNDTNYIYVHIPKYAYWKNSISQNQDINEYVDDDKTVNADIVEKNNWIQFGDLNERYVVDYTGNCLKGFYFKSIQDGEHTTSFMLYRPNIMRVTWRGVEYWDNLDKCWYVYKKEFTLGDHYPLRWVEKDKSWIAPAQYLDMLIKHGAQRLIQYRNTRK